MARWFKITLWVLGATILILSALIAYVLHDLRTAEWDFSGADRAHHAAEIEFLASLQGSECVTQDQVIAQAEARGWDWLVEPTFQWESCPAAASQWLRVMVEPSLFMSTDNENASFFVFDAQGCSIEWQNKSACND